MRSVNIADLRNRLSQYLHEVREGEELVVRDRNLPIAKIVPVAAASEIDPDDLALVATGQLRPPETRLPASFWAMPAPRVSIKRAVAALSADREVD